MNFQDIGNNAIGELLATAIAFAIGVLWHKYNKKSSYRETNLSDDEKSSEQIIQGNNLKNISQNMSSKKRNKQKIFGSNLDNINQNQKDLDNE